ncbi:MAG: pyridoxal phosphate-dependent aminotransferase [Planctomycetota bacterium]|jgi:aspartate/methionine/tyrosine aminotransferase|nr:pyridoxal phosphate-dependent aminotransferase [Planctomycetota bacterium]
MRTSIINEGAKHLEYEIRQIVDYGYALRDQFGIKMTWENIGDPVEMGEKISPWIVDVVSGLVQNPRSWAYSPSRGVLAAREYLADEVNRRGGTKVTPDDILFTNGVADAVDKIYDIIRKDARVLMQSPSYPTHSSNEAKRGDYELLQFQLDPNNDWQPDIEEIHNKIKYNPQVIALALVNPDNPTGMVYKRETLQAIADLARRYGLFLICDEIYVHLTYNGRGTMHLSEVLGDDIPALSFRGISKDYPWPGSRCGWIEMLNRNSDPDFAVYCGALVNAKMMEVCSTTLPQMSIPLVYGDPRFAEVKKTRAKQFEERGNEFYDFFKTIPAVTVTRTYGAFYFTVLFKDGMLDDSQTLPIADPECARFVAEKVKGFPPDKRFIYYMMASIGLCATPLSGFHTSLSGFRLTTLKPERERRMESLHKIRKAIEDYTGVH